jgi:arogenate/prephenate dehydratase
MDGIQDDLDNVTRFLMLARDPIIPRIDRPFKVTCSSDVESAVI